MVKIVNLNVVLVIVNSSLIYILIAARIYLLVLYDKATTIREFNKRPEKNIKIRNNFLMLVIYTEHQIH